MISFMERGGGGRESRSNLWFAAVALKAWAATVLRDTIQALVLFFLEADRHKGFAFLGSTL